LTLPAGCSHSVLMTNRALNEADTVGLVAELRELCGKLARQWAMSEVQLHRLFRDIAQPELAGPERSYKFRVEQWDKAEDRIMWVIAISNNLLVARAAYDAAVRYNPRERWLLRDGIRVVERHEPPTTLPPQPHSRDETR
jgi:hypothetical protein